MILSWKIDVREPEAPSDDPAVAEELADLVGAGRGTDVEVLGRPLEQKVPNTPADDVGGVAEPAEPLDDLGGFRVDQVDGDRSVMDLGKMRLRR